ncbi:CubicO group peptidase (beta-lactamase class C family) [Kineosphaera limosa]|uniref:Putative peptidase S12 family protein n=1 Tax=Kineosphaera limosa NBRC 100340 TaxID=1184609 RepID=K6X9C6_9MICO|nr:serine hydrolase domain-containing protein [Kineosphaera limosa]NYE01034.1 CubicO group peptidase (beta-lactamase class C family) [Kineosphaera limosa]GAB95419.1 putative peptidase S12 family protein [Kineosphaera limosa NBRC 100340]
MTEMNRRSFAALTEAATELEADGFSGILRATRGGEVVYESCHGLANRADRSPIHPGTRFATASLSKMFTAVAVLVAASRGEVKLSDRVIDVLPRHRRPATLRDDVTVEHLLTHTSGIADYFEEDENLPGYRESADSLWQEVANYTVRDDYSALLPVFADLPPVCPPGTTYHYSNAGYVLLGMILTQVSGMPFAHAVTSRVLQQAGMHSSGYFAFDEVHPDVAIGYLPPLREGGPWRSNIYSVHPVGGGDGGAYVTAGDVERFLRAVHHGGVWPGVTPDDLLTPRIHVSGRWSQGYGVEIRDDGAFGKDGGDAGVTAESLYRPDTDTTVVLLANIGSDDLDGLEELARRFVDVALS